MHHIAERVLSTVDNRRVGVIALDRVDGPRCMASHLRFARSADLLTRLSGSLGKQVAHSNKVVASQCHHPMETDSLSPPELGLSNRSDVLGPAKHLLDALAQSLAHVITGVPRGACIDRGATMRVVVLVSAECDPLGTRGGRHHLQRVVSLRGADSFTELRHDGEAVAVLADQVPHETQLRLLAWAFAKQLRLRISGRDVGVVLAPFAMAIPLRIATTSCGWLARAIARIVHRQPHEPAKQQVVVELLAPQPFTADGVEDLQQQRPNQLLRRYRGAAYLRVGRFEMTRHLRQCSINHRAHPAQRMALRNTTLRTDVAKKPFLVKVAATHRGPSYAVSDIMNSNSRFMQKMWNDGFSTAC